MQSTVERLSDEPIIVVTIKPHKDVEAEVKAVSQAVDRLIEEDEQVYRINDFSAIDISFTHITHGLANETRQVPGTLSDPRIKPVFVGTSDMTKLGAVSARQEQYGGIDILLFDRLENALEHIRELVHS